MAFGVFVLRESGLLFNPKGVATGPRLDTD